MTRYAVWLHLDIDPKDRRVRDIRSLEGIIRLSEWEAFEIRESRNFGTLVSIVTHDDSAHDALRWAIYAVRKLKLPEPIDMGVTPVVAYAEAQGQDISVYEEAAA